MICMNGEWPPGPERSLNDEAEGGGYVPERQPAVQTIGHRHPAGVEQQKVRGNGPPGHEPPRSHDVPQGRCDHDTGDVVLVRPRVEHDPRADRHQHHRRPAPAPQRQQAQGQAEHGLRRPDPGRRPRIVDAEHPQRRQLRVADREAHRVHRTGVGEEERQPRHRHHRREHQSGREDLPAVADEQEKHGERYRPRFGVDRQADQRAREQRPSGHHRPHRAHRQHQRQRVVDMRDPDRQEQPDRHHEHRRRGRTQRDLVTVEIRAGQHGDLPDLPHHEQTAGRAEDLPDEQGAVRPERHRHQRGHDGHGPELQVRRGRVEVQAAPHRVVEIGQRPRALGEEVPGAPALPHHRHQPHQRPAGHREKDRPSVPCRDRLHGRTR
jgi:hypothetical protein